MALNANFLNHFLIEIIQVFLAGILLTSGNLSIHFLLKLVKFKLDLFQRSAFLINSCNTFLEIYPNSTAPNTSSLAPNIPLNKRNFSSNSSYTRRSAAFFLLGINDYDIIFLAVTVTPSNPLFNALRIPWQIIIHNHIAKLKVNPFCRGFGGNQIEASSRKYSTKAARISAVGEPLTRSVPLFFSTHSLYICFDFGSCSCH